MTDFIQTEMLKEQLKSKHETSHILHLLLTIVTFGFWLIVWIAVTIYNSRKREDIDDRFIDIQVKMAKEAQ
jgi:hypothetical protein